MNKFVLHLLVTFIVFLAIDAVWLGLVAKKTYSKHLGYLMADKPNWLAAGIFYALFAFAVTYFIVHPAITESWATSKIALHAALFGLVTYATYDLTNLATIKNWPINITVIDLAWGTTLTTLVSLASVALLGK